MTGNIFQRNSLRRISSSVSNSRAFESEGVSEAGLMSGKTTLKRGFRAASKHEPSNSPRLSVVMVSPPKSVSSFALIPFAELASRLLEAILYAPYLESKLVYGKAFTRKAINEMIKGCLMIVKMK